MDDVRLRNHRSAGGVEAGVVHRLLSILTMWLPFDVTITGLAALACALDQQSLVDGRRPT